MFYFSDSDFSLAHYQSVWPSSLMLRSGPTDSGQMVLEFEHAAEVGTGRGHRGDAAGQDGLGVVPVEEGGQGSGVRAFLSGLGHVRDGEAFQFGRLLTGMNDLPPVEGLRQSSESAVAPIIPPDVYQSRQTVRAEDTRGNWFYHQVQRLQVVSYSSFHYFLSGVWTVWTRLCY